MNLVPSKYCTRRSVSAVESIGSKYEELFDVPTISKSIWDNEVSAGTGWGRSKSSTNYSMNFMPSDKLAELSWKHTDPSNISNKDLFNLQNYGFQDYTYNPDGLNSYNSPEISYGRTDTYDTGYYDENQYYFSEQFAANDFYPVPIEDPIGNPMGSPVQQITSFKFPSYKGTTFEVPVNSLFFVIKSYSILDVTASLLHKIWASTDLGNKRLSRAFNTPGRGKIFLFFSVNGSGKFCGVAEMMSDVDFDRSGDIWAEKQRWKGVFTVEWHLIKDVWNQQFSHLRVPENSYKRVTSSRDTQEVGLEVGLAMMGIMSGA